MSERVRLVSVYRDSNMQHIQHIQRFSNPIGSQSLNDYVWRILFLLIVMTSLLSSNVAFSADSPFKPLTSPDYSVGICPSKHKMYSISNTASKTPNIAGWIAGTLDQDITFMEAASGNKVFNITFSKLIDKNITQSNNPPFYGSITGLSSSAINLRHNSPISETSITNHILTISMNRSVSKIGYKIQDLDSTTNGTGRNAKTPYIEQVDASPQFGRLTSNPIYHTIDPNKNIVTAIEGKNCGGTECNIDATWAYTSVGSTVSLNHNNIKSENDTTHVVAYSDFYFCLAPPKLIVKKVLNGTRFNDTDTKRDQFEINTKTGTSTLNSFTTQGNGQNVTNNSSSVINLEESTIYTISEKVMNVATPSNVSTPGNIEDYISSYNCTNTATDSKSNMPSGTANSISLSNLNYGDEITCTIINTPKDYTFSGTVFNDNGGIPANENTKQNITATFSSNLEYFNGKLDVGESGIYDSALSIRLTDCIGNDGGTNIVTSSPNPQTVSNTIRGHYIFNVKPSAIAGKRVCVVESEPASWKDKFYSVDTTANNREVSFATNTYNYGSLDFGEVETNNTALVLIKSQYIHDCNSNLNYANVGDKDIPTNGFSIKPPVTNIEPGKCIAYKIEAYNRGHVALNNIRITDILQKTPVESKFHLPVASGISATLRKTDQPTSALINIGDNGVIITEPFDLNNTSTTTSSKRTLYFNTKYGTTVDP